MASQLKESIISTYFEYSISPLHQAFSRSDFKLFTKIFIVQSGIVPDKPHRQKKIVASNQNCACRSLCTTVTVQSFLSRRACHWTGRTRWPLSHFWRWRGWWVGQRVNGRIYVIGVDISACFHRTCHSRLF